MRTSYGNSLCWEAETQYQASQLAYFLFLPLPAAAALKSFAFCFFSMLRSALVILLVA